ncbi:hypothetical protein [Pseudonocardia sp. KRD291]|uniref:hypothetical protein n=1 Tax=Pseudonocardia sp. KRD291 TaxID=2792007 RepID=UPI001C49E56E|nr:hypothetical protein [Pseudonocardia sp. KRD291]MBW0101602.1 hypothetical protein [Pseudonocardia sp. KRD291]
MSVGRYALAAVIAATFATAACTAATGADRVTLEQAVPPAAGRSASAVGLLPRVDAGSSGLGVAVDGAIESTRKERDRAAAAAEEKAAAEDKARATEKSGGGCAQQAMVAGRFDPSCSDYQGYLDPGTSAGRAPTSGETQMQYACEQGLVPESDC